MKYPIQPRKSHRRTPRSKIHYLYLSALLAPLLAFGDFSEQPRVEASSDALPSALPSPLSSTEKPEVARRASRFMLINEYLFYGNEGATVIAKNSATPESVLDSSMT